MNNHIRNTMIFLAGAAGGSFVTWKLLSRKFETLLNEEIEHAYQFFKQSKDIPLCTDEAEASHGENEAPEAAEPETSKAETNVESDYEEVASQYKPKKTKKKKEAKAARAPYVIPPEEFGELENYEPESLTYWADGILTDAYGNIVEDIDDLVGKENLKTFGQYEDDSVIVRDDMRKKDYEILADPRKHSDI